MDLLNGYDSNSDTGDNGDNNQRNENNEKNGVNEKKESTDGSAAVVVNVKPKVQRADRRYLHAAPPVSIMTRRKHGHELIALENHSNNNDNNALLLSVNVQGPAVMDPKLSSKTPGKVDESNAKVDEIDFNKQRTTFQRTGRAMAADGSDSTIVRTTLGYNSKRLEKFQQLEQERNQKRQKLDSKKMKNEPLVYGSDDEVQYGIWAPPSLEERYYADNAVTDLDKGLLAPEQVAERDYLKERDRQRGIQQEEKEEESSFDRLVERKMSHLLPPKFDGEDACTPTTTFHGTEEHDYKGQSWMAPPSGLSMPSPDDDPEEQMRHHDCYVPKKCIHRFSAHGKGVHRIRLFPKTGHLLLSAGLDGKCKIWSVGGGGGGQQQVRGAKLMRTYEGHKAAVRDVQFNNDGSKFVSASFDRYLRLWDTETGAVLQTFTNKKVPYVVQFYPHDDNFFVVGCSDNKLVTYNATSGEITQEYNHHLAPVNAILFVEDHGTKMVTSSDDKKILVWEWDIGVPIKYISDPTMHSMPTLTMHPSLQFFVGQSLDNHIAVLQAGNRFTLQRKKKYSGHVVAGYACEIAFSPNGQFMVSGDGNGKLFFWDWKRHKLLQKYRAHDKGPAIACVWHPLNPSTVFTCGWDGVIKIWE